MHRGRIVRYGSKTSVLTPPYDDYTDLLLASMPQMQTGWLESAMARRKMASAHD
jgi:peptide/nickel transport system ATP-binding protein